MAHATLTSPEPTQAQLRCTDGRHRRRLLVVLCIVGVALAVGVAVAALTSHDTCQDGLDEVNASNDDRIKPQMLAYISNLGEHLSNSLAIFAARGRPDVSPRII
uniref:Pectinesterase inhibitor domain-containing protein n=1 Tax=Leersia perrieri TaxID=77586 RepID=A0A0D9UYM0_9ORYZ